METRRSYWRTETERARENPGYWHISGRTFTELSAKQIAADIRGHRRIRGLYPNEAWKAEAFQDDAGQWRIRINLIGLIHGAAE